MGIKLNKFKSELNDLQVKVKGHLNQLCINLMIFLSLINSGFYLLQMEI